MSAARTIGELFHAAVQRHGPREALVYGTSRWTYDELGRQTTAALAYLARRGMSRGRVAIIGRNDPAYVIGFLAAHVGGSSTVEIGRDESLDRVRAALRASRPGIVLTDRPDIDEASAGAPVVDFDALRAAVADTGRLHGREAGPTAVADPGSWPAPVAPDAEAMVVYTSGTTGQPKGVVLSHRNVLFVVDAVRCYLGLSAEDRYGVVLPLAHTYGKSNLLSAVAAGAAVVLVDHAQDQHRFLSTIFEQRCTALSVVPLHLNVLARRGIPPGLGASTLRVLTSSGGPLNPGAIAAACELAPGVRLFSMYGLTETATRVSYLPPDLIAAKPLSVGRALPGVELRIVDDDDQPLPTGTAGHIHVRGPNVMQGYLGEAALTAETITDGWLRTGDIGHLDEDDCLYLTGRDRDIIKVAGERVSPGEIEDVVSACPGVAEVAVVGMPDPLLGETIWAFVVWRQPAPDPAGLARFCATRLSQHRVPRRFIAIDHIPRTPTGKTCRHLLKESHDGRHAPPQLSQGPLSGLPG